MVLDNICMEKEFCMEISKRIQLLRMKKGLSQEQLAEKINVSRQTVSKWETGQSSPDIEKVISLCHFFEVTTDYLLEGIEKKSNNQMYTCFSIGLLLFGFVILLIGKNNPNPLFLIIGLGIQIMGSIFHILVKMDGEGFTYRFYLFLFGIIAYVPVELWLKIYGGSLLPVYRGFPLYDGLFFSGILIAYWYCRQKEKTKEK